MKQEPKAMPQIGLALLLSAFLLSTVGLHSTRGQTRSEQESQLRHSIQLWEDAARNDKVLLVPLPDSWSNQRKKRYIDTRTNPNYRGHYVQDPRTRRYYVPTDRDQFLKAREDELIKRRATRAQIDQMKRGYVSDSNRVKQYVVAQRLPKARQELAKLQPAPPRPKAPQPPVPPPTVPTPPPAPAGTPEQIRLALNALTDSMVKKWMGELEETIRIQQDSGPQEERANLDYWARMHLKTITGQVCIKTPAHQQAYRDYLDCLDREVYSSHLPTRKQIIDAKQACRDQLNRTLGSIP